MLSSFSLEQTSFHTLVELEEWRDWMALFKLTLNMENVLFLFHASPWQQKANLSQRGPTSRYFRLC